MSCQEPEASGSWPHFSLFLGVYLFLEIGGIVGAQEKGEKQIYQIQCLSFFYDMILQRGQLSSTAFVDPGVDSLKP